MYPDMPPGCDCETHPLTSSLLPFEHSLRCILHRWRSNSKRVFSWRRKGCGSSTRKIKNRQRRRVGYYSTGHGVRTKRKTICAFNRTIRLYMSMSPCVRNCCRWNLAVILHCSSKYVVSHRIYSTERCCSWRYLTSILQTILKLFSQKFSNFKCVCMEQALPLFQQISKKGPLERICIVISSFQQCTYIWKVLLQSLTLDTVQTESCNSSRIVNESLPGPYLCSFIDRSSVVDFVSRVGCFEPCNKCERGSIAFRKCVKLVAKKDCQKPVPYQQIYDSVHPKSHRRYCNSSVYLSIGQHPLPHRQGATSAFSNHKFRHNDKCTDATRLQLNHDYVKSTSLVSDSPIVFQKLSGFHKAFIFFLLLCVLHVTNAASFDQSLDAIDSIAKLESFGLNLPHATAHLRNKRATSTEDEFTTDNCDHIDSDKPRGFLWTLRRDPPSYFFGTVHVPYTRVWSHIPENVKLAFHRSDNVYFELDLTDRLTVTSLANCQMLPQGEYLSGIVPPEMFARLRRHLEKVKDMMPEWMTDDQRGRGLYADYLFNAITGGWERKRPVWVMLMVNSLTESDIRARGQPVLDLYLANEAKRLGKLVGSVEEVDEQCLPLNHLNTSQVLFALNKTLTQHEVQSSFTPQTPFTTDDLIRQYNCGHLDDLLISHNTAQVPHLVVPNSTSAYLSSEDIDLPHSADETSPLTLSEDDMMTARQIESYFRSELIYKRNERMAHRVIRLLRTQPNRSFFFALGAGHFIGNHTVIELLRRKGFDIEHTYPTEDLYMGDSYVEHDYPPLLADSLPESSLPTVLLDNLDPFPEHRGRHRHRPTERRRNRKKAKAREKEEEDGISEENLASLETTVVRQPVPSNRAHAPSRQLQFNELWVRIQSESELEPRVYFPATQQPHIEHKQYLMYHSCAPVHSSQTAPLFVCIVHTILSTLVYWIFHIT